MPSRKINGSFAHQRSSPETGSLTILKRSALMKTPSLSTPSQSCSDSKREPAIFQKDAFIKRTMGNVPFAKELATKFINDYPQQLLILQTFIDEDKTEEARKQAHKLKGALGNLGANLLYQKMWGLEKACKAEDTDLITRLNSEIPEGYRLLKRILEKWLHENTDS